MSRTSTYLLPRSKENLQPILIVELRGPARMGMGPAGRKQIKKWLWDPADQGGRGPWVPVKKVTTQLLAVTPQGTKGRKE